MNYLNELNKIMKSQNEIALASSIDEIPNVRIVNFCYEQNKGGIMYFSTFRDNEKTKEFLKNNNVAFTTVPKIQNSHVRSKKAKVVKSSLSIYDLKDMFIKKIDGYNEIIDQAGEMLDIYEIHFSEADVVLSFQESGKVKF